MGTCYCYLLNPARNFAVSHLILFAGQAPALGIRLELNMRRMTATSLVRLMQMKCLALVLYLLTLPAAAAEVALDVGHSRQHPGVISAGGTPEWELNRRLALAVAARLQTRGISHRLIGADGKMDVLLDRTEAAKNERLFISLHHDAIQPEWIRQAQRFYGYSLFVSRRNPQLDASLACARHVGDRLRAAGLQPSLYHAAPVAGENRPFADRPRGIHYYDGLAVLRSARQPALLIEAGVVVNPEDERRVTSAEGRERIAGAIAAAIADCLK